MTPIYDLQFMTPIYCDPNLLCTLGEEAQRARLGAHGGTQGPTAAAGVLQRNGRDDGSTLG